MECCRLTSARDALFAPAFSLYQASFPAHEQRPFARQAALMENPRYHFEVVTKDGAPAGILLYWDGDGYAYIEHFAIHPALRGQAVGSGVLTLFCEKHPFVVLEIDPPLDEISARREGFYRRLGFQTNGYAHRHPAYRRPFPPHALVVMSHPRRMTEEEYRLFRRELEQTVMKDAPADDV